LSWYDDAFNGVSNVYIFNPPTHGASTHDQLSLDEILNQVKNSGVNAVGVASKNDAYELLKKDLNNDSLILLMTSGALDGLPDELPKDLPTLLGGRTSK
jgi:UDP-N-acetylmuramate: L-alanyl-gamma-D-glutamyl-meso-diaminopimelate ligase